MGRRGKKSNVVPDGWLQTTKVGLNVGPTCLIAMKVPVKEKFNNQIELEDDKFTCKEALDIVKEREQTVKMVIDLTYTDKYYDVEEFEECEVEHRKIYVPAKDSLPPNELLQEFRDIVKEFEEKYGDDSKNVALVHCTLGVNRTGYFVCHYLITELNMTAEEAINLFNAARGHNLDRSNYLESLDSWEKEGHNGATQVLESNTPSRPPPLMSSGLPSLLGSDIPPLLGSDIPPLMGSDIPPLRGSDLRSLLNSKLPPLMASERPPPLMGSDLMESNRPPSLMESDLMESERPPPLMATKVPPSLMATEIPPPLKDSKRPPSLLDSAPRRPRPLLDPYEEAELLGIAAPSRRAVSSGSKRPYSRPPPLIPDLMSLSSNGRDGGRSSKPRPLMEGWSREKRRYNNY